jgi:hypothetical protein
MNDFSVDLSNDTNQYMRGALWEKKNNNNNNNKKTIIYIKALYT